MAAAMMRFRGIVEWWCHSGKQKVRGVVSIGVGVALNYTLTQSFSRYRTSSLYSLSLPCLKVGNTPLTLATYNGHTECISLLLAAGADRNKVSLLFEWVK